MKSQKPLTIGIGGGKGGVGKSMVSSNLAVQYALAGLRVIVIDLDFGAANLHTIFGLRQPPLSLGDYFSSPGAKLADFIVKTSIENLALVPSSGFVPELANLKHLQRVKLINQIQTLDADLILLDLGAGSSLNVVDFFSMTDAGIIVATPEPTSVLNAYEFLKNVVYRIFFRMFRHQKNIQELLKSSTASNTGITTVTQLAQMIEKYSPLAAENLQGVCDDLNFHLVFNQARKVSDSQFGTKLNQICYKYLNVQLNFSGLLFYNEEVPDCVRKMCPISIARPDSATSHTLKSIALTTLHRITQKIAAETIMEPFEQQLAGVARTAQEDFERNLLTQKRLQRIKEKHLDE